MWGYYWGFTKAEIELLAHDQPLIVYEHSKDKKERGKFKKANPLDVMKAAREWHEKYDGKEKEKIPFDMSTFDIAKSANTNN